MKASVVAGPLSTVDLDLYANLTVDAVTSGGVAATFSRSGNLLTVNLDRAYATGEMMDVVVSYHGAPSAAGYFGFNTANGRNLVWSLSEPFGARSWWPCKDAPEDKADSVDIRVTVPSGMITASNGTRIEATDNGTVAVTPLARALPDRHLPGLAGELPVHRHHRLLPLLARRTRCRSSSTTSPSRWPGPPPSRRR